MRRMYDGGPLPEIGRTAVTDRWFQAFDDLVQAGRTSKSRICEELGVERRNFTKQQKDHSRAILRPEWLAFLVLRHGVSADWLLTGRGWPFGE
jgi:hypothetical protein